MFRFFFVVLQYPFRTNFNAMSKNKEESTTERRLRHIVDEEWNYIPDTSEKYMVSNYGRVKSFCNSTEGKILKPSFTKGFKTVCLRIGDKRKTVLVHKLTADLFVNKNESDDMVIHIDWNKGNNYYKNLQWVNRKDGYDRILKRLHHINRTTTRKRRVTNSKLEPKDVEVLKSMLAKGIKQKVIAKLFCISEMQVSRIKKGENWGNIKHTDNLN